VCDRPNVLFERLTSRSPQPSSMVDRVVSYLLAAPLAAVTLPWVVLSWIAGRGQTLEVMCRATDDAAG
jgi:hypothetical protein